MTSRSHKVVIAVPTMRDRSFDIVQKDSDGVQDWVSIVTFAWSVARETGIWHLVIIAEGLTQAELKFQNTLKLREFLAEVTDGQYILPPQKLNQARSLPW